MSYPRPPGQPPLASVKCPGCGHYQDIYGEWDTGTGRWYHGGICPNCRLYSSCFISDPRGREFIKRMAEAAEREGRFRVVPRQPTLPYADSDLEAPEDPTHEPDQSS